MINPPDAVTASLLYSPTAPSNVGRLWAVRLLIWAITVIALAIGLLPALLFFHNKYVVATALTFVMAFAFTTVIRVTPTHLEMATPLEFMAAGLAAISQGAVTGFFAVAFYGLVRLVNFVGNAALGLMDYRFNSDWHGVATGVGLFFGGVLLPGIATRTTKGIMQAMFPPVAGPTPFWKWARSLWKSLAVVALAIVAMAIGLLAALGKLAPANYWTAFIAAFLLTGITAEAWSTAQKQTARRHFTNVEEAVGAILRAMRFTIVEQPRTGSAQYDPYLADLDFVASKDGNNFAVLIKEYYKEAPNAHDVSSVLFAADALTTAFKLQHEARFCPVLVAVGNAPPDRLMAFARHQGVVIIAVPDTKAFNEHEDLEAVGRHLFREMLAPRTSGAFAQSLTFGKSSYADSGSGA